MFKELTWTVIQRVITTVTIQPMTDWRVTTRPWRKVSSYCILPVALKSAMNCCLKFVHKHIWKIYYLVLFVATHSRIRFHCFICHFNNISVGIRRPDLSGIHKLKSWPVTKKYHIWMASKYLPVLGFFGLVSNIRLVKV